MAKREELTEMGRPRAVRTDLNTLESTEISEVLKLRYKSLEKFGEYLKSEKVRASVDKDDRLFSTIIEYATNEYGVKKSELAKCLNVSPAAIGRWAMEASLPPHYARLPIVDQVSSMLDDVIESQRNRVMKTGSASWEPKVREVT